MLFRSYKRNWNWTRGSRTGYLSGKQEWHHDYAVKNKTFTYKGFGYDLDKLQELLLVDFRNPYLHVTQETLNAGLMPDCAFALHRLSRNIGNLKNLDKSLGKLSLIDRIVKEFDNPEYPRNCYRSLYMQEQAKANTPEGPVAEPGFSPHGTGNTIDFPIELAKNSGFIRKAKKFGFIQRAPDDPRHFEFVGCLESCGEYVKDLVPRHFPRPQDVEKYKKEDKRILEANI